MKPYSLAWLDSLPQGEYGQKARRLWELSQKGFSICEGFALPTDWFEDFCRHNRIGGQQPDGAAILAGDLPDGMRRALGEGLDTLTREGAKLIVRSSAQEEDRFERSYAGIYDSVAHVDSLPALERAVKQVWASAFREPALSYRGKDKGAMGVIVQTMLRCEKSGVLFSRDPLQWERYMLLEAAAGGNEGITAGEGRCQRFRLCRDNGLCESPREETPSSLLSQGELTALFLLARKAERAFGFPVDLEWGISGGRIVLFQLRPEQINAPAGLYHSVGEGLDCVLLDRYALPATVCYLSLLDAWQSKVRLRLCGEEREERPLCFLHNRVYWNVRYQHEQYELSDAVPADRRHELFGLIRRGYRSWYRRIPRYEARVRSLGRAMEHTGDVSGLIDLMDAAVDNFCVYFGVDHFLFLGIAQLLYRHLQRACPDDVTRREAERLVGTLSARNKTVHSNEELLAMVQRLRRVPDEYALVREHSPQEVCRRIRSGEAPVLARQLGRFLKRHGHRSVSCDDLAVPHWGEAPERIVALLAQLAGGETSLTRPREAPGRRAELARRMAGAGVTRRQAGELLTLTGEYMRLRENQRYYFDKSWVLLRGILLKLGRLFVRDGRLERPEDIFHLSVPEVRLAAAHPVQPMATGLIKERARLFALEREATPPYMIKDSSEVEVQKGAGAASYKGLGISPGTVRGRVCHIRDVDDFRRLHRGDIGVVRTFHPSWTPMLRVIAGLIMNYGNLLSHGAVVAREYGVPVAVFHGEAMRALCDGDEVELNGATGRIRVLRRGGNAGSREV